MQEWIKNAVFYQIYPTSFYDSNKDGIGDINGIREKLNYIKDLGVNAVWINPFFKSPFKDGGYDIADYYSIDERFGDINDFKTFIKECKRLNIKIIIDLVIGHTSVEHEWFKKSALNENNEYSDYYIWTDNIFNKYMDKTIHGLYERNGGYYINYYACQPALNYGFNNLENNNENENDNYSGGESWKMHYTDERLKPLREEVLNIMRFWMNLGIDGFRVDLANSLVKGCVYNSKEDKDIKGMIWLWNQLLPKMREEYKNIVFIAEWVNPINAVAKCGFDIDFLAHDIECYNELFRNEKTTNLLPNFEKGDNYFSPNGKGDLTNFINYTIDLNNKLKGKGYFSAPSGSHDQIRLAKNKNINTLKCIFSFLLTYKHIPFIYYGDEIGMIHNDKVSKDGGYIRTGARTPMQWDNTKNRGFSVAKEIYLPVNNIENQSVSEQIDDENSLLNFIKKLIKIRKQYTCLNAEGNLDITKIVNGGYPIIYERSDEKNKIVIIINPKNEKQDININYNKVLLSNNCTVQKNNITLKGESCLILLV